jgi:uncharacterized protein DUF4333
MAARLAFASLAALLAAAAGCGGGGATIDHRRAEKFVGDQLLGPRPASIDCPKGVESKKGKTFGCTVIFRDGTSATVTVHVVSDSGRVRVSPADFHPHEGG